MKTIIKRTFPNFLMITLLFFFSCKKEHDLPAFPSGNNSGSTGANVSTGICGQVVDEANAPIPGAIVSAHGKTTTADSRGLFIIQGISAPEKRCYVTVSKPGYFPGSRIAAPVKNGITNYRIMLLSNIPAFNFPAGTGGTASLGNGCEVSIPANSVMDGNTSYSGTVYVALKHIDPASSDFAWQMPGDLSTPSGEALHSFGMLSVELTGTFGQKLQIASGKQATIKTAVPSSMLSLAPSSIPLWHFDEVKGEWRNEGSATLSGGTYTGTVSHFSTWNCDANVPPSYVTGRVVDGNGKGIPGISVSIYYGFEITDAQGYFTSTDPSGIKMTVEVKAQYNLGLSSQPLVVGPLNANQTFNVGNIVVQTPSMATGTITDCSNNPLSGMVVGVWNGGFRYTGTSNGTFNMVVPANQSVTLYAYAYNGNSSSPVTYTSQPSNTYNAGNMPACSSNPNSFTINGGGFNNQQFTIAATMPWARYYSQNAYTWGLVYDSAQVSTLSMQLLFPGNNTGTFNSQNSQVYFSLKVPGITDSLVSNINISVTQYGNVGSPIKGTYSGTLTSYTNGTVYTISNGQFSFARLPDL